MLSRRSRRTRRHVFATAVAAASIAAFPLLAPRPAAAWYGAGHEVIALLAYQDMKPETRAKVDAILKAHPDYPKWLTELPAGAKPEDTGKYIFAIAATWPDRIKDSRDTTVTVKFFNPGNTRTPTPDPLPMDPRYPDLNSHNDWHYVDLPVNADGKERPPIPDEDNLLLELPICKIRLAQKGVPPSWRAYYLAWVEHLVGDVHQPLHCTARFSAAFPTGDQGGNLIRFDAPDGGPRNLHAYWDSLLGDATDWPALQKTADGIRADETALLAGFDPATRDSEDFLAWAEEGLALDKSVVYADLPGGPDAAGPLKLPGTAYHDRALATARQRGALAARRLARLLDDTLAKP